MKFLTWILILCFTSQAMASTLREGLELAMNDYEYEMVVEWDQKDAAKAEAFTKKFTDKLEDLYKQGLSDEVVMKYIESRVMDKKQLAAIQASAALTAKNGSSAQNIAKALRENKLGHQGASWTGGAAYAAVIGGLVIITALIVYQLVWNLNHRCATAVTTEVCGTESYCDSYSYDWETGSEYCDSWYETYECSNVEYCQTWEKIPK